MDKILSNEYPSLLSRDESNSIKGLLILLVILAHNSILMSITGLYSYIYSFHVYCFLILPFLYGISPQAANLTFKERLKKLLPRIGKYGLIYLLLCLFCSAINCLIMKNNFDAFHTLWAIITGNQYLLKIYINFGMLWFIPLLCGILFWHLVYFSISCHARIIIVVITTLLWFATAIGYLSYQSLGAYFPLGLLPGLYFFLCGITSRKLILTVKNPKLILFCLILAVFSIPTIVHFRYYTPAFCYRLTWLICPILAMFVLYHLRNFLKKSAILVKFGENSFKIYIIHIFIFNAILMVCRNNSLLFGIASFMITTILSLAIACLINKISFLKNWL